MTEVAALVEKAIDAAHRLLGPEVSRALTAKAVEAAHPFLFQAHMAARQEIAYAQQKDIGEK